jgi:hypothetical protein
MAKIDLFLSLEESMIGVLMPKWQRVASRLSSQIIRAIERNDMAALDKILYSFDTAALFKGDLKKLLALSTSAVLFGAANARGSAKNTSFAKAGGVPEIVTPSMKQFQLMLGEADKTIRKEMVRLIEFALQEQKRREDEKIIKAALVRSVEEMLASGVTRAGEAMVQLTAQLHTSRLSAYGFLVESQVMGYDRYQVNEQLDNRTCQICRMMHGKTFDVAPAFDKLDSLLRIDDPQDLKQLSPWPKQDANSLSRIAGMDEGDLVSAGWNTPPYHPGCRGLLVKVGTAPPMTIPVTRPPVQQDLPIDVPLVAEKPVVNADKLLEDAREYVLSQQAKIGEGIEFAVVYDDTTGEVLARIKGGKNVISWSDADGIKMKDKILVHNHPLSGGSLSVTDLYSMYKFDMKEVIAVSDTGGIFRAKRVEAFPGGDWRRILYIGDTFRSYCESYFWKLYQQGKVTREEAVLMYKHVPNVILHRQKAIDYLVTGGREAEILERLGGKAFVDKVIADAWGNSPMF